MQDLPDASTSPPSPGGRVMVYGEVLFDHYPDGSSTLGGAPFNLAWHLCGFGVDPVFVSSVGDDPEGHQVLDEMEGWGIGRSGVALDPDRRTGRVLVEQGDDGPSFSIPEDQVWDHIPVPDDEALHLPEVDLLYHGTLALRSPPSAETLRQLRDRLSAPVFVDLNLREPWWTREVVDEVLHAADWAKVSREELSTVAGDTSGMTEERLREVGRAVRHRYDLTRLLITCGADGSLMVDEKGQVLHEPAAPTGTVVDSVGAGDAFSALVAMGMVAGWDDATILRRANRFAADVCAFQGATIPDLGLYDRHLRHWSEPPWPAAAAGDGDPGLRVLSLSIHGLVRATDMELGRDADTGGQVAYVVDQAKALAESSAVERVDLVTRQVFDHRVDDSYAEPREEIVPGASIVRLPFGPRRYLHKESLWPWLDSLIDQVTRWVRSEDRLPDVIHGHYADAGYVGAQLSKLLGVPFVFTGHSLGRIKRERLLEDGMSAEDIERRYRIGRRIEAEEQALEAADLVIASTRQEAHSQYEGYDHYQPKRMEVIPPGVDLTRFSPPSRFWPDPPMQKEIERFLEDPDLPMVLALARPDPKKNFLGLIEAFAGTPGLRDKANLVLIAGNRDDIAEMKGTPRRVLTDILLAVDRFDLHGSVAYPKHHRADEVPDIYRLAARSRGILVNAALNEPFGLTIIEAAASGLPVVVTDDGGPQDILSACRHGVLVDATDPQALGQAILDAITDRERWGRWVKHAVANVHRHFSWRSHASRYVSTVSDVRSGSRPAIRVRNGTRLPRLDRLVVVGLDSTLTADADAVGPLAKALEDTGSGVGFAVVTHRGHEETLRILEELGVERPDILVTAAGTAIHYGSSGVRDRSWERQIRHRWEPDAVREALRGQPGLTPAPDADTPYRLRYHMDAGATSKPAKIRKHLRQAGLLTTVLAGPTGHVDVIPGRASPDMAIRFLAFKWNLSPHRILVAGGSAQNADLFSGETLSVVVANHDESMDRLRDHPRVHFSPDTGAAAVLEGIRHYDFFGRMRTHDETTV